MKTHIRNIILGALLSIGLGIPYLQAADVAISALPAGSALAGTEPIPMVQGAATKKTTPADISTYLLSGSATTEVLANNAGAFDGDSGFTFNATNNSVDLGGATLTASDPVLDLTQTWNNAAVPFTAVKVNVTDTASAAASLLQDWQVGGSSIASLSKSARLVLNGAGQSFIDTAVAGVGRELIIGSTSTSVHIKTAAMHAGSMRIDTSSYFSWSADPRLLTGDLFLYRDAAGVLAQRNGTNAQTLRVYDTYTDASNYGRIALNTNLTGDWVQFAAETGGTGGDDYGIAITPSGTGQVVIGAPAAATSLSFAKKAVASITDATATTIFTVTVPNAAHSAMIAVDHACSLGAGGAIGANEATGSVSYNVSVARTAGVNAVATISAAYGSSSSSVAGAATITVTSDLGAVAGAVGDPNTFTIRATVTKGSGSSDNHTCTSSARLLNANATGVTIS